MPDASQAYQYTFEDRWAFTASYTFTGATTGMTIPGTLLVDIGMAGVDLAVEGLTARFARAGGGAVVSPIIYSNKGAGHYLTPFTTALTIDARHYAPLDIPMKLSSITAFSLNVSTAALDVASLSAWGRYLRTADATETLYDKPPTPVSLERIKLWGK